MILQELHFCNSLSILSSDIFHYGDVIISLLRVYNLANIFLLHFLVFFCFFCLGNTRTWSGLIV